MICSWIFVASKFTGFWYLWYRKLIFICHIFCSTEDAIEKNPKQNIIWGTKTQPIFDKEKKGQLNSEVLGNILRFYLIEPRPIEAENITPYLGQRIQDYEDEKERVMTFFNFRRQISQVIYKEDSLRRYRPPEMYEWERIYKVKFTRRRTNTWKYPICVGGVKDPSSLYILEFFRFDPPSKDDVKILAWVGGSMTSGDVGYFQVSAKEPPRLLIYYIDFRK